ncbi:MAG: MFS transporter [Defluviicoccus sp.]|nr:MFS transporter [Defluviicoccus sp.]MDE0275749.1 MFS transporter [Defluviicoccus sp.]
MTETGRESIPGRVQAPVYALAFCYGNIMPMASVVVPLWALELTSSPFLIGLVVASRQFLVVTLSIYGGALLDRAAPQKVILALAAVAAASFALFPALPFVWAAVLLQMISGFAETTNWIGAQALFGRVLKGAPVYAGRLTAAARTGGFIGPFLVGLVWQYFGPTGAFLMLAGWVMAGAAAALFLPRVEAVEERAPDAPRPVGLMPKLSDYTSAFRMLALPAVALVVIATVMRQTGTGIQSSFYGVWLKEIGFEAGTIGFLIGISSLAAAFAALSVGKLSRRFADRWLLIGAVAAAIMAIAITPVLDTMTLLVVAICIRGVGQGLNLPLMMTIAARAVGADLQGRVAALRITFNRLGGALVPLAMGAVAEVAGLENAFYAMGAVGILGVAALSVWIARSPGFAPGR